MTSSYEITVGLRVAETEAALLDKPVLVSGAGKYFHVGGLSAQVLRAVDAGYENNERISEFLLREQQADCSSDVVDLRISDLLAKGLISIRGQAQPLRAELQIPQKRRSSYFAFQFSLLPASVLRPITSILAPLYHPRILSYCVPVMFLVQVVFVSYYHIALVRPRTLPSGTAFIVIVVLNYLGLVWHELGHAAACKGRGVAHGAIGIALYLVFPAFYTDVSEAWKLHWRDRLVVDSAGIFATLCLATLSSAAYLLHRSSALLIVVVLYDLTVLMNLNPFIRMDMYWILTDVLQIGNLIQCNKDFAWWLAGYLRGRSWSRPAVLMLRRPYRELYVTYFAASVIFLVWMVVRLLWWYTPHYLLLFRQTGHHLYIARATSTHYPELLKELLKTILGFMPFLAIITYGKRRLSKLMVPPQELSTRASL